MKFAKKTATYGTVNKQPNNPGFERPWILSGEKATCGYNNRVTGETETCQACCGEPAQFL